MDYMHCLDCKGLSAVIFGSLVSTLMRSPSIGRTRGQRFNTLNAFCTEWYDAHPGNSRLPRLRETNIVQLGWAELSAPDIKAANTRHAAPLFAAMAARFCDPAIEQDALMLKVTSLLVGLYTTLKESGMFFKPGELARFSEVCLGLAETLQSLRALSESRGFFAWQIKPKANRFCHFPLYAGTINPRVVSCYADESHIGTCCAAWKKSLKGRWQKDSAVTVAAAASAAH